MSRLPTLALGIALATLVSVGCAAGGGAGTPAPSRGGSAAPAGLDGRTFLSTRADGRLLVAGTAVRLSFDAGTLHASAGCNSMSGTYTLDGRRLLAGALATTEMACDPALMDQDAWLAELLDGAEIGLADETLTLTKAGVTLTLLDRVVADPDRPLLGTRWVVDGLITGGTAASVPAGVNASLTFADGRVRVETGCNSGGGPVDVTDGRIAFRPIALTAIGCAGPAMAVERAMTTVLTGSATYTIEGARMTLMNGGLGLMLRAG